MTTVSVTQAKIERIVRRLNWGTSCEFSRDGAWFCCQAYRHKGEKEFSIRARVTAMTCEEAAVVAVAIQMALDWITEEMTNE